MPGNGRTAPRHRRTGRRPDTKDGPAVPAIRMTARSAGSRTLPLPAEPPPLRRLRCVLPRFQGSVSPGLGEPLPPLEEPSSAAGRTSGSSPDMACGRGSGRGHAGGLHTDRRLLYRDTGRAPPNSPLDTDPPRVPPQHPLTPPAPPTWPHPPAHPRHQQGPLPAPTSLRPGIRTATPHGDALLLVTHADLSVLSPTGSPRQRTLTLTDGGGGGEGYRPLDAGPASTASLTPAAPRPAPPSWPVSLSLWPPGNQATRKH